MFYSNILNIRFFCKNFLEVDICKIKSSLPEIQVKLIKSCSIGYIIFGYGDMLCFGMSQTIENHFVFVIFFINHV